MCVSVPPSKLELCVSVPPSELELCVSVSPSKLELCVSVPPSELELCVSAPPSELELCVSVKPSELDVSVTPERLRAGEEAELTCESRPSLPAAQLSWWSRGQQITDQIHSTDTEPAGDHGGSVVSTEQYGHHWRGPDCALRHG